MVCLTVASPAIAGAGTMADSKHSFSVVASADVEPEVGNKFGAAVDWAGKHRSAFWGLQGSRRRPPAACLVGGLS
jgi:hypothetical protein